jgi:hypothetical protein
MPSQDSAAFRQRFKPSAATVCALCAPGRLAHLLVDAAIPVLGWDEKAALRRSQAITCSKRALRAQGERPRESLSPCGEAGLRVKAKLDARKYSTGVEITKTEMRQLALRPHKFRGGWNYEFQPRDLTRLF